MIAAKTTESGYALTVSGMGTLDQRVLNAAAVGLARGLALTVSVVQRQFLSGPRPARLGSVTGRLLQSITSKVEVSDKRALGTIGSDARYAAFHELGFSGTEHVRESTRRFSVHLAKGAVIGARAANGQYQLSGGRKATHPGMVKAHDRKINYAGRPFLHPALEQMMPAIFDEIQKELKGVDHGK